MILEELHGVQGPEVVREGPVPGYVEPRVEGIVALFAFTDQPAVDAIPCRELLDLDFFQEELLLAEALWSPRKTVLRNDGFGEGSGETELETPKTGLSVPAVLSEPFLDHRVHNPVGDRKTDSACSAQPPTDGERKGGPHDEPRYGRG